MMSDNSLIPIDGGSIRKEWHNGEWHYSVIDMISVLLDADYKGGQKYWSVLKTRLKAEGSQLASECSSLKLRALDGKMRLTDVVNTEQALRLIQSIPSPKVEPLKLWLAQVGAQKIEEASEDPEAGIYRAMEEAADKYRRMGRADIWIDVRVQGIVYRKQFTEALKYAVVNAPKSLYAQSTDKVYKGLLDVTTAQLRGELNITPTQNPRDYMGEYALIYIGLTERLVRDKLKEAQTVLLSAALEIIWDIAKLIRERYLATQQILGKDLLTEKPLLDRPKK